MIVGEQTQTDNTKRIAKNTLLLYMRMLFNVCISLVTSRLVLNILGVEDYGIYNVVGGVVMLFSFLNAAMASSTQRFLTIEMGKGNHSYLRIVFSTSTLIHLIISLMILFFAETIGLWLFYHKLIIPSERLAVAMWVYQTSVLNCITLIMSVPYNASIIAHERMDVFAYISMLDITMRLVAVIMLSYLAYDKLISYSLLLFSISLFIRFIYVLYCRKHLPETRLFFVWDRVLLKRMSSFAVWNLFGNMAYVGFTQGVNVLLNIFFGPTVNAARAVAVQLQGTLNNFCNSFQTAINPQIMKSYAAGNKEYMYNLIIGSSKYSFLLLLLMALPLMIETEQVLQLWLYLVPEHTVTFLRIILLTTMVDVFANPLITSAQATGHIRNYQIIVGGILLLIVPVSYLVLKMGGDPQSVFVVHLCVVILAQFVRLWMIRRLIGISLQIYFQRAIIPLLRVCLVVCWLPMVCYYVMDAGIIRVIIVVFTSCMSVLFWGYILGLERNEREYIQNKVVQFKQRFV